MSESIANRDLLERLNRLWHVAGAPPAGSALPSALIFRVRLMLARLLAPQETFNAAVVEYINATSNALEQARIATDEAIRYRESLAARERRIETSSKAILDAQAEIRTSIGQLQQATQALKREMSRLTSTGVAAPAGAAAAVTNAPYDSALDAHQYVGFEDQFRGSPAEIRERLEAYVPLFAGAGDVLDVGCGRGEFLLLLREHGITARGVDVNPAMVQESRERGLEASEGDALGYLAALSDESLGGLFAAQVIEHLEPAYLLRFLEMAFAKLRPGAPIVLETINPACWFAFFSSYIRDITHAQPVHPDTLKYLLVASGFQRVTIDYRSPYPEQHKLQRVEPAPGMGELAAVVNENADKLNRLLFTHLDYAAVGYRP
jgi:SAM-dependent methyltransferase